MHLVKENDSNVGPFGGQLEERADTENFPNVQLSPSDARIVLVGRETAQRAVASFIEEELSSRSIAADCHNREREGGRVCRESFYFVMLNLLRAVSGVTTGRDADPLFSLTQAADMLARTDFSDGMRKCGLQICRPCGEEFKMAVARAR